MIESTVPPGLDPEDIDRIASLLTRATSVLFITGAGLSADSGLPTYRGIGGLYSDRETDDGMPIEAVLSGDMLTRRPELTWRYIHQIESTCRGAVHNRGHEIIAAFEKKLPRVWVLTQNVDGLHREAGSRQLIEIHGNLHDLFCTRCPWRERVADYSALAIPPACELCGALIRPDVVLFGEMLPESACIELYTQMSEGFDMVFSIGTTSAFPYIAQPVLSASSDGTPTIEINPGDTEVSEAVSYRLRATARDALEAIWIAFLTKTTD